MTSAWLTAVDNPIEAGWTQWLRVWQLVVGAGGVGQDLSNLRINFEIIKTIEKQPNKATIKVYNINRDTATNVESVYKDIFLIAGYRDMAAQIFAGNIQYVSYYRESADYIIELTCGDGDRDYRNAHVNFTLVAGSTDVEAINQIVAQMPHTTKGTIQVGQATKLRGRTVCGMARDALTDIARSNGCNWSIQDGKLQMVRVDQMLDANQAYVITADTGLLGVAERNDKGIGFKCLLNPKIKIDAAVRLDNSAIKVKQAKSKMLGTQKDSKPPVNLNPDGIYKVIKVTYRGDTRANEWETEVECVGLGQPIPASRSTSNQQGVGITGSDLGPEDMSSGFF